MPLSIPQRNAMMEALRSAFDKDSLTRMLWLHLDIDLPTVAGGHNLDDVLYNLIRWAERNGRTKDLIVAAQQANKGHAQLADFAKTFAGDLPSLDLSVLYFVTSSQPKFHLYRTALDALGIAQLEMIPLDVDLGMTKLDQLHTTLPMLAQMKLDYACKTVKQFPFVVEQSGLEIPIWNNLPGGLSDIFFGPQLGCSVICKMLYALQSSGEIRATVTSVIHYVTGLDTSGVRTRTIHLDGVITPEPRGIGWGWEPIFAPSLNDNTKTLAELSLEEKCKMLTSSGIGVALGRPAELRQPGVRVQPAKES